MKNIDFDITEDGRRVIFREPAWDDMKYPAQGINPPGAASDPTRDTTDGMLLFSPTATNIIAGGALFPHNRKLGSPIEPHIHWCPTSTGTGNVLWRLEYSCAPVGGVFPAYTTVDVLAAAGGVNDAHTIASLGEISLSSNDEELAIMFKWKVSRIGGDATDTYAANARLMEFDIHYQIDGIGSQDKYSKGD